MPIVLYGGEKDTVSLKVDSREFRHVVHGRGGEHAIVQLDVADNPTLSSPALLKDVQHDPVRGDVLHADFQRIRLDERIVTLVPIILVGQARGIVDGGVLDHQLRELEVECLALEVPDQIQVDVSGLGIGDSVHVDQVTAPPNVRIVTELDRNVAAVHAPRVVRAEAAAEAAAEVAGEEAPAEGAEAEEKAEGEEK